MLKLKLQYFGHLMGRTDSFEKTLMLGKIENNPNAYQKRIGKQITTAGLQFNSVTHSCLTLCDPMDCSTPGLPVHHQLMSTGQ